MNERRREEDNLTSLADLSEKSLLDAISCRYSRDIIYTDVGDILVAVNPFRELEECYYSEDASKKYAADGSWDELPPHIYAVAARAFTAMLHSKKSQICVISGESGAGKTESSKLVIQQLIRMSRSSGFAKKLQRKITKLDPVLEAFGNARTVLNSNSSRFGKFVQIFFSPLQGGIVGASLEHYLLEKSRVCHQNLKEQNFHIFYHLLYGSSPDVLKTLKLEQSSQYQYLPANDLTASRAITKKDSFDRIEKCMVEIGFNPNEILEVITILAAILHIGNIEFGSQTREDDSAIILNKEGAKTVTELLGLESAEHLSFALTTLRTTTRGETVDKLYTPSKARETRDAMAKELYFRLFSWLISRINVYLNCQDPSRTLTIGILDIFGFECFRVNSFEQLCINLANEQLQQYFNEQIFAMEKEEYEKEGLEGVAISYQSNQPVLDLLLSRPIGLLSLIDEQCRINGRDDAIIQLYKENFKKSPVYKAHNGNRASFTIRHYAGDVEYQASGFIDKNKDSLPDPVQGVLKFSSMDLLRCLFTRYPDFSTKKPLTDPVVLKPSERSVMKRMSVRKSAKRKSRMMGRKRRMTVGAIFRDSLYRLMEKLLSATPHFIRCIKPNVACKPRVFDDSYVEKQLRYTGMVEAVRVRKEGFSYRPYFSEFVQDYRTIAFLFTDTSVKLSKENCIKILEKAQITDWKIGKSRIFLRYYHKERLNSLLHAQEGSATIIQKVFRGYKSRRIYEPLRTKQTQDKLKVGLMMKLVAEHSERAFSRIVELNRDDAMKSAERFGYLKKEREEAEGIKEPTGSNKKKPFRAEGINGVKVLHVRPEDIPSRKEGERKESNNSIPPTKRKIAPPVPPPKPSLQALLKRKEAKAKNSPTTSTAPQPSLTKKYSAIVPPVTINGPLSIKPSSMPTMPVFNVLQQDEEIGDYAVPFQRVNISFGFPIRRKSSPAISTQQVSSTVLPMQTGPSPIPSFYEDDEDSYGYTIMTFPTNPSSPAKICTKDDGDIRGPMGLREETKDPTSFISQIDSSTSSSNDSDDDSYMDMTHDIKLQHLHDLAQDSSLYKTSSMPDITLKIDSGASSFRSKAGSDCTSSNIDLQSLENSSTKPLDVPLIHRQSQMHYFNGEVVEEDFRKPRKRRLGHFFRRKDPRRTRHFKNSEGDIIPGYLPGLWENDAKLMLSSTPKGTYLLYTGYNESDNFTFKLSVSLGGGVLCQVWSCDIDTSRGLSLMSDEEENRFNNLEELAEYYKYNPVNKGGLILKDPFLISKKIRQKFM
uniref:non-specific serine/threonine protein kinase n=1 Tax=Amphimedon queenslandica TaxID=400682 RepID=A0A1X7U738_AMPQE